MLVPNTRLPEQVCFTRPALCAAGDWAVPGLCLRFEGTGSEHWAWLVSANLTVYENRRQAQEPTQHCDGRASKN